MTERPYTDDDLRTEAARQHAALTEDPDFVGIGEGMEDGTVDSTSTDTRPPLTWEELLDPERDGTEAYETAQRKIHDLINGAADVSEWAINLGADGLQPDEHAITVSADEKPIARIHFAFEPGMDDDMRQALVEGIGHAIDAHL